MFKVCRSIGFAVCALAAMSTTAWALPGAAARPNFFRDVPAGASKMREGHLQLAPMPFVVFCLQYPSDCAIAESGATVVLTSDRFSQLKAVNDHVNAAIRPQEDSTSTRFWKLDVAAGDCNEFAVQKRHELIKAGWPSSALLLTVAKTSWGEGHLLVTVRTDHGDLILDSLTRQILTWDQAAYHWVMRQSTNDPSNWVAIDGGSSLKLHRDRPHRRLPEAPMVVNDRSFETSFSAPMEGRLFGA